ncbi:hypothetical protein [Hymenobacter elongatus]|uniref:Uncharacterized protein n=1 Tax=Hymenobacter elongatus TaxID=877208 RepID=A0A4Z0PHV5_9BACT|nr:hypothetical protein [Hymenobacter elongatus]TGE14703.1 hypothetical protein E5J99_15085 [Hymenobacter elongatus]
MLLHRCPAAEQQPSSSQATAVKQATQQELQQLSQLDAAIVAPPALPQPLSFTAEQVLRQYDEAMLHILTPGQYSAFQLLQERQSGLQWQPANSPTQQ